MAESAVETPVAADPAAAVAAVEDAPADLTAFGDEPAVEEPTDEEPSAEPVAETPAEIPPAKPEWDKERQQRDQDAANTRKALDTANARTAQLEAELAARNAANPPAPAVEPPTERLAKVRAELKTLQKPDEYADLEERDAYRDKRADLLEQVTDLAIEVDAADRADRAAQLADVTAKSQAERNLAEYNLELDAVCKEFGEEHRNAVNVAVRKRAEVWGTPGHPGPTHIEQLRDTMRLHAWQVVMAAGGKPGTPGKPKPVAGQPATPAAAVGEPEYDASGVLQIPTKVRSLDQIAREVDADMRRRQRR